MTKSLIAHSQAGGVFSTATFHNFCGGGAEPFVESQAQITATEGFTLSKLRGYKLVGTGSADTVRARKNVADGNQLLTFGANEAGYQEDASNTDAFSTGDELALAFADGGTDPVYPHISANIEFASGHGSIHGAVRANQSFNPGGRRGPAYGAARQFGSVTAGQIKNRAYSSIASYQVNVQSNTTTTGNALFEVRVNDVQVASTVITVAPGLTGIFEVSGLSDALADGDLIHFNHPLVTIDGTLVYNTEVIFLKSTTAKCDVATGDAGGTGGGLGGSRTASATPQYFPLGCFAALTTTWTDAQARTRMGFTGTASRLRIQVLANNYTDDLTLKLFKNGSAVMTVTVAADADGWAENTVDTSSFVATDEYSLELVGGGTGSALIYAMMVTLEDTSGAVAGLRRIVGQPALAGIGGLAG